MFKDPATSINAQRTVESSPSKHTHEGCRRFARRRQHPCAPHSQRQLAFHVFILPTHLARYPLREPRLLCHPAPSLVVISTELLLLTVFSMYSLLQDIATDCRFGPNRDVNAAVVPAAAHRVLCGEDTPTAVSVGRLPQLPWGLLVPVFTHPSRSISEYVTFERASYLHILAYSFVTRVKLSAQSGSKLIASGILNLRIRRT